MFLVVEIRVAIMIALTASKIVVVDPRGATLIFMAF
jgi:hypothetical protein